MTSGPCPGRCGAAPLQRDQSLGKTRNVSLICTHACASNSSRSPALASLLAAATCSSLHSENDFADLLPYSQKQVCGMWWALGSKKDFYLY